MFYHYICDIHIKNVMLFFIPIYCTSLSCARIHIPQDLSIVRFEQVCNKHLYLTSGSNKAFKMNEREMFYLTTHSTHFIYGYMASDLNE